MIHRLKPDIPVYIIRSKETWNKTEKHLSGSILIPDFQAEEIPAIENNTTIFIHNENNRPNILRIPQRTISFLADKLRKNGYDDPYKLLQKTQGLYYYIRNALFTGTQKHPGWEKDNDKAVVVAALLGKWMESDGDKTVIEKLYGNSSFTYRETDKIIPYTNRDLFHFYVSYTKILLTNINGNLDRLIKLLDLLPNCTDELFIDI